MEYSTGTISTVADPKSSNHLRNDNSTTNEIMTISTEPNNDMIAKSDIFNKVPPLPEKINYNNFDNNKHYHNDNKVTDELIPQFESKTKNIQLLHDLLSSIQPFGDFCMLDISSEGMCFSIIESNICKIRLNINKKLFENYTFNGLWRERNSLSDSQLYAEDTDLSDESNKIDQDNDEYNFIVSDFDKDGIITINLNLTLFLEMINVRVKDKNVDQNIKCTFRFHREGDPFVMEFEDELIVEKCELRTYYIDKEENRGSNEKSRKKSKRKNNKNNKNKSQEEDLINDFELNNFIADNTIFRLNNKTILFDIIIKSPILFDIIKDMCDLNTENFIIYCKKSKDDEGLEKDPKIIFISKSKSDSIGFSKLIIDQRKHNVPEFKLFRPISSTEKIEECELEDCYDLSLSSTYRFSYFSKLLKSIRLSRLIKIRKDMSGITSLLLLLGKNSISQGKIRQHHHNNNRQQQQPDYDELYGSSIEFITCESISIDELSSLVIQSKSSSLLSKLGYNDKFVEQLIKDDRDIQTIRIGNDGQLITLDDYFHFNQPNFEFEELENVYNRHDRTRAEKNENDFPTENNELNENQMDKAQDNKILKLTEKLTMSLLGHETSIENSNKYDNDIEVEQTIIENDNENVPDKRKRASNYRDNSGKNNKKIKGSKRKVKGKGGNNKKENDGIETVGGAIEIPLFI